VNNLFFLKKGMLCCIIFGGFMKTSTKGIIAAIGFVLSIGVYYFLVQGMFVPSIIV